MIVVTKKQLALVNLVQRRFEEIGLPKNSALYQGEMTQMFLKEGYVAVSCPSVSKRSFLYRPDAKFHEAFVDVTDPHTFGEKL